MKTLNSVELESVFGGERGRPGHDHHASKRPNMENAPDTSGIPGAPDPGSPRPIFPNEEPPKP